MHNAQCTMHIVHVCRILGSCFLRAWEGKHSNIRVKAQLMSMETSGGGGSREIKLFRSDTTLAPSFVAYNLHKEMRRSNLQFEATYAMYMTEMADGIKAFTRQGNLSSLLTAHPSIENPIGWIRPRRRNRLQDEVLPPGLLWAVWSLPGLNWQESIDAINLSSGVQSIEHPNVLREQINFPADGSPNWSISFCGTLTQYIFRVDKFFAPPTPPAWWYVTKHVKFCHFGESQIKGTPQIGVYPEKFNIGFLAQFFLGVPTHVWKPGKKFGPKSQC